MTVMNRTRTAYRVCLAFSLAAFATSAVLALTGRVGGAIAIGALGACGALMATHLQLRTSLGSHRSLMRAVANSKAVVQPTVSDVSAEAVQTLPDRLDSVERSVTGAAEHNRFGLRAMYQGIDSLTAKIDAFDAEATKRHQWHVGQSIDTHKRFELLPSEVAEHASVRANLASLDLELPTLGGWALSGPTTAELVRQILRADRPLTVVELGSGASTAFLSLALTAGHGGRVLSVDHDPQYAAHSRETIERLGVSHISTVIDAPVATKAPEGAFYDLTELLGILDQTPSDRIDLLLVDGPPAASEPEVRYSALPLLASRLADGATVCLDDTFRPGEKKIVDRWLREFPGLTITGQLEKSTIFTWTSEADGPMQAVRYDS